MQFFLLNLFAFLTVAIGIAGNTFSKIWSQSGRIAFAVLAVSMLTLSGAFWLFWLKYARLSIAVSIWAACDALLTVFVGTLYFQEKLTSGEIIAIIFILGGIFILGLVR